MRANVLLALLCGALLMPLQASAETGFASTRVNLRAGPGIDYPVITVIPAATALSVLGCLSDYSWCDVAWGADRGWVAARYVRRDRFGRSIYQRHGPAVTPFDFNAYWNTNYRDRPFYRDRDRWHSHYRSTFGGGSQTQVHPGRQSAIGNSGSTFGPGPRPRPGNRPPHGWQNPDTCQQGTPGCPRTYR